ncbi:MAG: hypothetical protein GY880_24725 [Planctomycetaceae bacterium]|nr:hypothetical protein [Planctomycetaceae bacterium]
MFHRPGSVILIVRPIASVRPIMSRVHILPLVCVYVLLAGCHQSSDVIPHKVDRLILYSLECDFDENAVPEDAEMLHGYLVLGKTEVDSAASRTEILDAVRTDIANGSSSAKCFEPHHAIRIGHDDRTSDVVICYKCRGYECTENGKLKTTSYPMDVHSRELLNRVLTSDGITLSPAATEELKQ